MLTSAKSRRILHVISVTLAILVFGYGLFLKYLKHQDVNMVESSTKQELVKHDLNSQNDLKQVVDQGSPN